MARSILLSLADMCHDRIPCLVPLFIVLLAQGANVIDLACMVEVMLHRHHDDPTGLLQLARDRPPWAAQLGRRRPWTPCSNSIAEAMVAHASPPSTRGSSQVRVAVPKAWS